jgi:hypothetical protein
MQSIQRDANAAFPLKPHGAAEKRRSSLNQNIELTFKTHIHVLLNFAGVHACNNQGVYC